MEDCAENKTHSGQAEEVAGLSPTLAISSLSSSLSSGMMFEHKADSIRQDAETVLLQWDDDLGTSFTRVGKFEANGLYQKKA